MELGRGMCSNYHRRHWDYKRGPGWYQVPGVYTVSERTVYQYEYIWYVKVPETRGSLVALFSHVVQIPGGSPVAFLSYVVRMDMWMRTLCDVRRTCDELVCLPLLTTYKCWQSRCV